MTADFTITGEAIGRYTIEISGLEARFEIVSAPATDFTVSSLVISPDEVAVGEVAGISVLVTNTSTSPGVFQVTLNIIGSNIMEAKEVTLEGGASQQVTFSAAFDTAGKMLIEVNGLIGGLVITGEVPPPSQIPLPAEASEPVTPLPESASQPSPATSGNNWLLIGLAAVAGLVIAAFLIRIFLKRKPKHPSAN